jgi:four helix bundle protein
MKGIESYRDLDVWKAAMDLVETCYRTTQSFPAGERFGLRLQVRRTAVSIPSNIAEGHERGSRQAYLNHVLIARGSGAELETQLEICRRLKYLTEEEARYTLGQAQGVGRQLSALVRALNRPQAQAPGPRP